MSTLHSDTPTPARIKWHYAYYMLAAFDMLTISFSLFLNHQIMSIYEDSVLVNQDWAEKSNIFTQLGELGIEEKSIAVTCCSLDSIARELIIEMKEATLNGYMGRLEELLDRVEVIDNAAAASLRDLAGRYEYDALVGILEQEGD
ncbi:MAG: hypothetical protein VCB26_12355 [Candidatus Hydrogenedentota bacterium]